MKCEIGKSYILDSSKAYYSVDIQRKVIFTDTVVVKCIHTFGYNNNAYFGYLVDSSGYETVNEIEFSEEDIIEEYRKNYDNFMYMEFSNINKHMPEGRMYHEVLNHYQEQYKVNYNIASKALEKFGDGTALHKFLEFAQDKKEMSFEDIYNEYNKN